MRKGRTTAMSHIKRIYTALIFIFLYAPILTLIVLSFNKSKTRAKWGGFTFKWYASLFTNRDIMEALYTTLLIAVLSSAIATIIGVCTCLGLRKMRSGVRTVVLGVTNIPMLNADIVTGISLMLLFLSSKLSASDSVSKTPIQTRRLLTPSCLRILGEYWSRCF